MMTNNLLICKKCDKNEEACKEYCVSKSIICNKCLICKFCIKKSPEYCGDCCQKCKSCEKILVKNNWPFDIIINNNCEKCSRLCVICSKYCLGKKAIIKEEKLYCENCLEEQFYPTETNVKFKIHCKLNDDHRLFLKWKKTSEHINCSSCNKKYWKSINKKELICKKCINKPKNKVELTENETLIKMLKCFSCYSNIIINNKNLKYQTKILCSNCKPDYDNKKYKYDKGTQSWIIYREKIDCYKCNKSKWMFTKELKDNICKKCLKN